MTSFCTIVASVFGLFLVAYSAPVDTVPAFISKFESDAKVSFLSATVASRPKNSLLTLKRNEAQSHCPRPYSYKLNRTQIDLTTMRHVIKVGYLRPDQIPTEFANFDSEIAAIVEVEALISMEELVDFLLPRGLVPAVVPEFKGITVGGNAISLL